LLEERIGYPVMISAQVIEKIVPGKERIKIWGDTYSE
jgi:hypothetical protein